ncbi:hypothetical protein [Dactylosporangium sp. NPDC049140]|uniref:hypothetical protein n=1 Tax=Dactylosporangium sp. NPDC049140 TaxID=3155647 RepID=UPI00340D9CC7
MTQLRHAGRKVGALVLDNQRQLREVQWSAGAGVTMAGIAFTMEAPVLAVASGSSLDRSAMASFVEALIRDPHAGWAYNFTPFLLATPAAR